jgi:hypothetical protein
MSGAGAGAAPSPAGARLAAMVAMISEFVCCLLYSLILRCCVGIVVVVGSITKVDVISNR